MNKPKIKTIRGTPKQARSSVKGPRITTDQALYAAAVASGISTMKFLDSRGQLPLNEEPPSSAAIALAKAGSNPFELPTTIELSPRTLRELARIRKKRRSLGKTDPATIPIGNKMDCSKFSLPIDISEVAKAQGLAVFASDRFGKEFHCLIEYSRTLEQFTLIHSISRAGVLPLPTRLAVARHLGHFILHEEDLRTGAISDTTHLDVDPIGVSDAVGVAVQLLFPDSLLEIEIGNLAEKYALSSNQIRFRFGSQVPAKPPFGLEPAIPIAVTPSTLKKPKHVPE